MYGKRIFLTYYCPYYLHCYNGRYVLRISGRRPPGKRGERSHARETGGVHSLDDDIIIIIIYTVAYVTAGTPSMADGAKKTNTVRRQNKKNIARVYYIL